MNSFSNNKERTTKGFFNNYDSIFVLLGETEELENFRDFNKWSDGSLGWRVRKFESC